ncbi:MAG: transporter substrate-binding domain-containing protein [Pseudomonadota bacterium]
MYTVQVLKQCIKTAIWPVFVVFLFVFQTAAQSIAQDKEPLIVGWSEVRPLFYADNSGAAAGFGAEIMRQIAEKAGLEIRFRRFDRPEQMIRAQAAGETDLLPAIAALPLLSERNEFSAPIAQTNIRIFIRAEDTSRLDPEMMRGHRIAIPAVSLGTEGENFLARNTPISIPVGTHSLTELLRGSVDGVVASDTVTLADARQLRLDHRIAAVGAPLRSFDRVVAVDRAHADLMPAINAAIADLEADGTLAHLRQIFGAEAPTAPPDILTVGVADFPPYNIRNSDGTFTGFGIETTRDLARLAGFEVRFQPISMVEFGDGPSGTGYDMLPQAGISAARREKMDFTLPLERFEFAIFTRAGEGTGVSGLDTLGDRTVGVVVGNLAERMADNHGGLDVRVFDERIQMLQELRDGKIDAFLYPLETMQQDIDQAGLGDAIIPVMPPFRIVERAPALRLGLAEIRERMNAVIPGYLISDEYAALRQKYFGRPVLWTETRLYVAAAIAVLIVLGLLTYLILQRWHQRQFVIDVLDKADIAVTIVDRKNRYTFFNTAHRNLHPELSDLVRIGGSIEDTQAKEQAYLDESVHSADYVMQRLRTPPAPTGTTTDLRMKDGRIFERTAYALEDGGQLAIRKDVTVQRTATENYANHLEALIRDLELTNREQAEFTYAVSHDLKSPSTTIAMLIDELKQRQGGDAQVAEVLAAMSSTNQRMRRLVDDVLTYSRVVDESPVPDDVDLNAVVDDVRADLAADIAAAGADIVCQKLPTIPALRTQIAILLQNLIGNAVKFRATDRAPRIEISSRTHEDTVELIIADNGIGIAEDFRERVFGLFQRLHAQSEYEGTGLGLTICRRIMATHGGTITAGPGLENGTAFTLTFRKVWDVTAD